MGTDSFAGATETTQHYYGSTLNTTTSTTYYIPTTLTTVTITGGNILVGAFYNCITLTNITIEKNITEIRSRAFYNCTSLVNVTLGENLTEIGGNTFYNCTSLKNIYFGGTYSQWASISFGSFSANPLYYTTCNLYLKDEASETGYSLANGVIKDVILDNITSIGSYAFYGWTWLESITIPNSVTSIGTCKFYGCISFIRIRFLQKIAKT